MVDDIVFSTTESRSHATTTGSKAEIAREYELEAAGGMGYSPLSAGALEYLEREAEYFAKVKQEIEKELKIKRNRREDAWQQELADERAEMADNGQFDLMDIAHEVSATATYNQDAGYYEVHHKVSANQLNDGAVLLRVENPEGKTDAEIRAEGGLKINPVEITDTDQITEYTAIQTAIDAHAIKTMLYTHDVKEELLDPALKQLDDKGIAYNKEDSAAPIFFNLDEAEQKVVGDQSLIFCDAQQCTQLTAQQLDEGLVTLIINEDGSYELLRGSMMSQEIDGQTIAGGSLQDQHATVQIDGEVIEIRHLTAMQMKRFETETGVKIANFAGNEQERTAAAEILERHTVGGNQPEIAIGQKMTLSLSANEAGSPKERGDLSIAGSAPGTPAPNDSTDEGGEADQEGTKDPNGPEQAISGTDEQEPAISIAGADEFALEEDEPGKREQEQELVESGAMEESDSPSPFTVDVSYNNEAGAPSPELKATVAAHAPEQPKAEPGITSTPPPPPPPPRPAVQAGDLGNLAPSETPNVAAAGNTASYSSPDITLPPSLQGVNDNDMLEAIAAMNTICGFGAVSYVEADHAQSLLPTAGGKAMPEPDKDKEREDDPFSALAGASSAATAIG